MVLIIFIILKGYDVLITTKFIILDLIFISLLPNVFNNKQNRVYILQIDRVLIAKQQQDEKLNTCDGNVGVDLAIKTNYSKSLFNITRKQRTFLLRN